MYLLWPFAIVVVCFFSYIVHTFLIEPRLSQSDDLKGGVYFHLALALVTVVATRLRTAEYGRYVPTNLIPVYLSTRWAWCLQEAPCVVFTLSNIYIWVRTDGVFRVALRDLLGPNIVLSLLDVSTSWTPIVGVLIFHSIMLLSCPIWMFLMHYTHRSIFYPLLISPSQVSTPLHICLLANLYCTFNAQLQSLCGVQIIKFFPQLRNILFCTFVSPSSSFCEKLLSEQRGSFTSDNTDTLPLFSFQKIVRSLSNPSGDVQESSAAFLLMMYALTAFIGMGLFYVGMFINLYADYTMVAVRKAYATRPPVRQYDVPSNGKDAGESTQQKEERKTNLVRKYPIINGFLFRYVACPNYFGELLEWTGYGLCLFGWVALLFHVNLSTKAKGTEDAKKMLDGCAAVGFSFAIYTAANLIPRALSHHAWYKEKYGKDYIDLKKRAIIPGIL